MTETDDVFREDQPWRPRPPLNTDIWSRGPAPISASSSSRVGACAAVVHEAVHGLDPCTPEEFTREYGVPLDAVREVLDYVANNLALIEAERDREAADVRARGLDRPTLP